MNKLLHMPLIVAGLSLTSAGMAFERNDREAGFYAGASAGYYRINDDDFLDEDDRLKDNRVAWRAYAGFEAGRIFAIEAAYTDFGDTSDGQANMELTGVSGAVLINIPLLEVVAPYGKLGVMSWDRKRSLGPLSNSDSGSDIFYGLGVRFALASNVDMRLEYERYDIDDTDIDMASINLQYRF
ncbi:porin family protein [Isoalcanivorax indicus]|uniref:porin family protein n=1 Tax=Isoalcanivorax indicus TaxID=2202653 RepID=UPI0013C51028|nr:porin family protein [Isoalcanivorax indicus]